MSGCQPCARTCFHRSLNLPKLRDAGTEMCWSLQWHRVYVCGELLPPPSGAGAAQNYPDSEGVADFTGASVLKRATLLHSLGKPHQ